MVCLAPSHQLSRLHKLTPFEALGGFPLPRLLQYIPRTAKLEAIDDHLKSRKGILNLLKHNLLVLQDEASCEQIGTGLRVVAWEIGTSSNCSPTSRSHQQQSGTGRTYALWSFSNHPKGQTSCIQPNLPSNSKMYPICNVSCLEPKLGNNVTPIPTLSPVDKAIKAIEQPLKSQSNGMAHERKMQLGNRFTP